MVLLKLVREKRLKSKTNLNYFHPQIVVVVISSFAKASDVANKKRSLYDEGFGHDWASTLKLAPAYEPVWTG